jgi:hypothetical protein
MPNIRFDRTVHDLRSATGKHLHNEWKVFPLIIVNVLCTYRFENLHIIKQCETFVKRWGETNMRIELHFWVRNISSELLLLFITDGLYGQWSDNFHRLFNLEKKREREREREKERERETYFETYILCQFNLKTDLKMSNKKCLRLKADNSNSCIRNVHVLSV